MYAVFESGGHQYRAAQGDTLEIQLIDAEAGDVVEFEDVLLVGGDDVSIGQPLVKGASVRARVIGEVKGPKLIVQKYKPKNRYKVKTGHRQRYTRVEIEEIRVS